MAARKDVELAAGVVEAQPQPQSDPESEPA